ncbi:glycosyltransferase [Candidatus Sumerlaeota bacterium]|nr:glycosyltransferase [Candidatus Sumerlaeota bacterium]
MELSIIIPTLNEAENVRILLPKIHRVVSGFIHNGGYEILLVDAGSSDDIGEVVKELGAKILHVSRGYGLALGKGFEEARGKYIITMDADLSHNPHIIPQLYSHRHEAELIIASRYVKSGYSSADWFRTFLSHTLNWIYGLALDLNIRDMSSGFRLYHRRIFDEIKPEKKNFVALLEILLKAHLAGFRIREIPFHYYPRKHGGSKARILKFGMEYLGFLWEGWKLRNSVDCADYEDRVFSSRNSLQGIWHRKRYKEIVSLVWDKEKILDVGCGSSQILDGLPQADGCDVRLNKLRYKRSPSRFLVRCDAQNLPFRPDCYDAVICSDVIEHLRHDSPILDEIIRIVKPGGRIVISSLDYDFGSGLFIKGYKILHPYGYGARHVTPYNLKSLCEIMKKKGCEYIRHHHIFGLEMIVCFQKKNAPVHPAGTSEED